MAAVTSVTGGRASDQTIALIVAWRIRRVRSPALSRPTGRPRRLATVRGQTGEIARYAHGAWAVLVTTAAICTACGSASQSSTSMLPLSAYLVRAHEETGMQRTGPATAYLTPARWTSGGAPDAAAENKRLAKEGFREAISVQTSQGVSWVMHLGSASAAAREEATELKEFASGPLAPANTTRFTIPGVSSADGWVFPNADANVLFTEGPCLMLVGDDLTTSDNKLPVVAAAHAIWTRTHGKPGPCAT